MFVKRTMMYSRRLIKIFSLNLQVDKNYLFGYVFFRQIKDNSLKRGYFQKVMHYLLTLSEQMNECYN